MNRSKTAGVNCRTRLLIRTRDVGDYCPFQRIPRKSESSTVVASRGASAKKLFFPPTRVLLQNQQTTLAEEECKLRRDSKTQLDVASDGTLYEKAKSRRVRQRAALLQSGNRDEAVPLGHPKKTKHATELKKRSTSVEVQDLQKQFEQKSHFRRASITHGLRQQQQQQQQRQELQRQVTEKKVLKKKQKRKKQKFREERNTWDDFLRKSEAYHAVANPIQPGKRNKEGEKKSQPRILVQSVVPAQTQAQIRALERCKNRTKQEILFDSSKTFKFNAAKHAPSTVKQETSQEVIDLVLSDTESDDDGHKHENESKNDVIRELTNLLQNEAIGRGASRLEMKEYAHRLLQLGLHSREMILDALDFSIDLEGSYAHSAAITTRVMASQVVNQWEWMKPFHKTIFNRWVRNQQQQR